MKKSVYLFLAFITLLILFTPNLIAHALEEVIYIDPGHGGYDGGCVGNGLIEKDINLKVAYKLQDYLETAGFKVKLTRNEDTALDGDKAEDIYKRVRMINNSNTLLYISIHANSYPHESVKGAQVFYHQSDNNQALATIIQNYLRNLDIYNTREAKSYKGKYILDHIEKPGCLVEVGFLTSPVDADKLKDDIYLSNVAFAVYLGIMAYLDIW